MKEFIKYISSFITYIWSFNSRRLGFIACTIFALSFLPFGFGILIYCISHNEFWTNFFILDGLIVAWIGCFFLFFYVIKMVIELIKMVIEEYKGLF